jgi:hypothetical protein
MALRYATDCWNKYRDILENQPITNNCFEGFNYGWTTTMNKKPSWSLVLEGFLNKEAQ